MTHHIILLGAPRSGTTFLAQAIAQHPDLAYWDEPRLMWKYGNEGKSDILMPDDATDATRRYVQNKIAAFLGDSGKSRYFEKQPAHALRINFINQVLPEAKFIHILRNGYDATASIYKKWITNRALINPRRVQKRIREAHFRQLPHYTQKLAKLTLNRLGLRSKRGHGIWGPEYPGIEAVKSELGVGVAAALQWKYCVELACAHGRAMPEERYLEISFKNLDLQQLERIMDFMELGSGRTRVRDYFVAHLSKPVEGEAARKLPIYEFQQIDPWIRATNSWLGFSTING